MAGAEVGAVSLSADPTCYSPAGPLLAEKAVISTSQLAFHRSRYRATLRLFRQLRHDLATPLSGAALHLEVAARRLGVGGDPDFKRVLENVRMGQLEVGYASAMLEVLSEVVRSGDDDGSPFPLPAALANGIAQTASGAPRGVSVTGPVPANAPALFGSRRQMQQAVADLTFHAVRVAEPNGVVAWELCGGGAEATLVCRWKGKIGDTRPEQVFSVARDALGESRGLGLLLARWTIECHGGEISGEQADDEARFVARLPVYGEESAS